MRDQIRELLDWLYREADSLDRETGDNVDDLVRAGRQGAFLLVANKLSAILDGRQDE
jgi:hypothetical protein